MPSPFPFTFLDFYMDRELVSSSVTGLFCMYSYMTVTGVVLAVPVTILRALFCSTSNLLLRHHIEGLVKYMCSMYY